MMVETDSKCNKCGHKWATKHRLGDHEWITEPDNCPNCNSTDTNFEVNLKRESERFMPQTN